MHPSSPPHAPTGRPLAAPIGCDTVVCVCKSGGEYGARHVLALQRQLQRHAPGARLICLTDLPELPAGVECRPLQHDLPGWFSKLEIFALPERCFLYLDLDVVITRSPLVSAPPGLWLLRGFKGRDYNSSLMLVHGHYQGILERFLHDKAGNIHAYSSGGVGWGDQDFIRDSGLVTGALQDMHPNLAASWKVDLNYRMGWIEPAPAVLVFHGSPKPEQLRIDNPRPGRVRVHSWRYWPLALAKKLQQGVARLRG